MIRSPAEHGRALELTTEIVIVGTGPGGAAAAARLAEAGAKVLLLEAGRRYLPQQLVARMAWAHEHLFQARAARVARGEIFIPVFSAEVIGGGSFVNSAICFRAPDVTLRRWVHEFGLDFASPDAMRPLYDEVERDIQVTKTTPGQARGNNLVFKRGVDALGWSHQADFMSRNAPGCIGCGVCRLGCPVAGKGSTDTNYLRRATAKGAEIYTEARVSKVLVEQGRAVGVEGAFGSHALRIRANHVVLAGGAFGTPLMLMASGLGNHSGHLGRNLRLHPSAGTFAIFPEEIRFWDGVTQGYYLHDPEARILLETFSDAPEVAFTAFPRGSLSLRQLRHVACCGGLVGDHSAGSFTPSGHDVDLRYELADVDRRTLIETLRRVVRVYFAAGASEVLPGVAGSRPVRTIEEALAALPDDLPSTALSVQSSHPHGSARMAARPEDGVVRPDGRVHGVDALWVADASLFPTAVGVNPQVTIMAFAKVVADRLLAR